MAFFLQMEKPDVFYL